MSRIVLTGLTKQFGQTQAVDHLTVSVRPGAVTALLGPNGAGKTTILRMLLGLVRPTAGTATIGGQRYAELANPITVVGAMLEATGFHPGRTALNHLRMIALPAGIPQQRCEDVIVQVGLAQAAYRKVGQFSLGMRQRLGLAVALLGDPPVIVLDEPTNGLDPRGVLWLRATLRSLTDDGRTVLLSSHVLAEVEQIADDILILSAGRLVQQTAMAELRQPGSLEELFLSVTEEVAL